MEHFLCVFIVVIAVVSTYFIKCKNSKHTELKKQQYVAITDTLREVIVIVDYMGAIIDCNSAAKKIFGYDKEELISQNISILVPPAHRQKHLAGMEHYRKTGELTILDKTLDLEGLHKDGTLVPIALSVVIVKSNTTPIFCAVVRDVTQRRADERKIHILNETLKTRVAALESFQFSVVHDLNAPLRAMEGFSEILSQDYKSKLDAVASSYIARIQNSANRMRQLINDMLRLSRITQGDINLNKESVNLSDVVSDVLNEHIKTYNPTNRKYIFNVQPDILVEADIELLTMAVFNLISNAWKFTGNKDTTEIEFGAKTIDNKVVYYIRDNGVGFDSAKSNKLFKPFSRLHDKKEFDGNGVGLAIVKQVITLHDGEVWAEGKINQGATFYFTIGTNKHA